MESQENRFVRKIKEDPYVPIGILGMLGTVAYGAYRYKTSRKVMSTSVFLMQLRVAAQGVVVGCITVGVAYNALKDYLAAEKRDSKE